MSKESANKLMAATGLDPRLAVIRYSVAESLGPLSRGFQNQLSNLVGMRDQ